MDIISIYSEPLKLGAQTLTKDVVVYKEFDIERETGRAISPVRSFSWGKLKPGKRLKPPVYVHNSNSYKGVFAWTNHPDRFHFSYQLTGQMWKVIIRKGTRVCVTKYNHDTFKIRAERMTLVENVGVRKGK